MTIDATELMRLMQLLVHAHDRLLRACQEQRLALIHNDIKALNRATAGMETLVTEIQQLEAKRQQETDGIASQLNIDPTQLSVSDLTDRLDNPSHRRIIRDAESLQKTLHEIRRVNEQNALLTAQSMQYIRKTLDIVSVNLNAGQYGRKDMVVGGRFMDMHA